MDWSDGELTRFWGEVSRGSSKDYSESVKKAEAIKEESIC